MCHSAVSLSRPNSMVYLGACIGRATCCLRRTSDEISDSFEEKLNLRLLLPASSLNFGQHRSREAPKCSNEQGHCRSANLTLCIGDRSTRRGRKLYFPAAGDTGKCPTPMRSACSKKMASLRTDLRFSLRQSDEILVEFAQTHSEMTKNGMFLRKEEQPGPIR